MKCEIPSFVSDFVSVVNWADSDGNMFLPNQDYGNFSTYFPTYLYPLKRTIIDQKMTANGTKFSVVEFTSCSYRVFCLNTVPNSCCSCLFVCVQLSTSSTNQGLMTNLSYSETLLLSNASYQVLSQILLLLLTGKQIQERYILPLWKLLVTHTIAMNER